MYGLTIRPGTTDLWTVMETFERKMYAPLCSLPDAKVIIDLGANIGDSAVYFAKAYPNAKIIAVECDDCNFQVLLNNVKRYSNVIPVKAAIWGNNKKLLIKSGQGENSICVCAAGRECLANSVKGLTMHDLIKTFGIEKIDILKIDIEGAEKNLFEHDCSWLSIVQTIGIELHDSSVNGCAFAFFDALVNNLGGLFTIAQHYEVFVVRRVS